MQQQLNNFINSINEYALSINPQHETLDAWQIMGIVRDIHLVDSKGNIDMQNLTRYIVKRHIDALNFKLAERQSYASYKLSEYDYLAVKGNEAITQLNQRFDALNELVTQQNKERAESCTKGKLMTINAVEEQYNHDTKQNDFKLNYRVSIIWLNELIFNSFGIADAFDLNARYLSELNNPLFSVTGYKNGNLKIKFLG